MNWDLALFFALCLLFGAAQLARRGKATQGSIVSFVQDPMAGMFLPASEAHVRLHDGREVTARLDCCTACLGRLREGDEVNAVMTTEGWVIDLKWRPGTCGRSRS